MNLSARMIVVLTTVGLISGSLLALVGMLTKDRIAFNREQEINAAILEVVPGAQASTTLYEDENITIYGGKTSAGELVGYAVYTSGTGFQDVISLMFGTDMLVSQVNSLSVLEQKETPGLGAKITDQDVFLKFWENRDARDALLLHKPAADTLAELAANEVNTITGATISSVKVLEIVNLALEKLKQIKQAGKLVSEENNAE